MAYLNKRQSNSIVWIIFMLFAIQTIETLTILSEIPPPPSRPNRIQSREELKRYLQRIHEYYSIVSRPRFVRSLAMEQYLDTNDDNSILPTNDFNERLKMKPIL